MLDDSADLQKRYAECLLRNAIPVEEHGAYKEWLGSYLDFCKNYEIAVESKERLASFIAMLIERNMADGLQRQAARAIGLFLSCQNEVLWSLRIPEVVQPHGAYSPGSSKEIKEKERILSSVLASAQQIIGGEGVVHHIETDISSRNFSSLFCHQQDASSVHGIQPVNGNVSSLTPVGMVEASWEREYSCFNDELRTRNYSPKTLKTYRNYVRKFQTFTRSIDPQYLTSAHVKEFLDDLAGGKKVSATTQNIAFNSLLFFFRHVLGKEFGRVEGVVRAKRRQIVPVVLYREEIGCILGHIEPSLVLVVKMLYGCGLKLSECLNLRVHSINFAAGLLAIHNTKGREDRKVPLPQAIMSELQGQVESVRQLHSHDLDNGYAGVFLLDTLEKKPKNAARELNWQWLFPAMQLTREEGTGDMRRYHLHETHVQKAIKRAVKASGIAKKATAHTFRHSYASHLLQNNYDIHTIQELLGHGDVRTTMIYTRTVKSRTLKEARSPLDF